LQLINVFSFSFQKGIGIGIEIVIAIVIATVIATVIAMGIVEIGMIGIGMEMVVVGMT